MDNRLALLRPFGVTTALLVALLITGCAGSPYPPAPAKTVSLEKEPFYLIGPGDSVNVFVWRNPELSSTVTVRPDGYITTPLVEDVPASDKTPTRLARDMEKRLAKYIKEPVVTVIVAGGAGPYEQQVRVVGEAVQPQAIAYREKMSLLDLMIVVGGLTDFAAGNKASIIRTANGEQKQYNVRIDDLIRDGDISANVDMQPGDIVLIPESFF